MKMTETKTTESPLLMQRKSTIIKNESDKEVFLTLGKNSTIFFDSKHPVEATTVTCGEDYKEVTIKQKNLPTIKQLIDEIILERFKVYEGKRSKIAKSLGISTRTLRRRLTELGIKSHGNHRGSW